jgi:hypothetical protein
MEFSSQLYVLPSAVGSQKMKRVEIRDDKMMERNEIYSMHNRFSFIAAQRIR